MAKWTRNKVDSNQLNDGQEYTVNDNVSLEQLNSMVNAGLYAQDFVEKLVENIDTSEANNVGTPTVTVIAGDSSTTSKPYKKLKFANLKGEKGDTGATGNGISNISKTGTSGLIDTYKITFTNGNSITFTVTNGKSITNIAKTATSGLVDTYTITFNDNTISTFQVVNGKGISNIEKTGTSGLNDTYTISYNDNTTSEFIVTNGAKGDKGETGATGATGASAGFGTPTATIDNNVGTPSVTVTASGSNTSKVFNFAFKNLKGEKGDKGESGEIYQTTGTSTTGAMSQDATTKELKKKLNVTEDGAVEVSQITLGSVVITPIVDEETGESGIRFSIGGDD